MAAVSYVTEEGYNKMLEELKQLETVERPNISKQIAEARDKGDLSENAEYDAAKEAQGLLESKISLLKEKILYAKIIDQSRLNTDVVQILNKVKIKNTKNGAKIEWLTTGKAMRRFMFAGFNKRDFFKAIGQ